MPKQMPLQWQRYCNGMELAKSIVYLLKASAALNHLSKISPERSQQRMRSNFSDWPGPYTLPPSDNTEVDLCNASGSSTPLSNSSQSIRYPELRPKHEFLEQARAAFAAIALACCMQLQHLAAPCDRSRPYCWPCDVADVRNISLRTAFIRSVV
jgi:hypothetical protein